MDKKSHKLIGAYFKDKRIEAGLSQAEVARLLGYESYQLVSNWEQGTCSPPLNKVAKLIEIYSLSKKEVLSLITNETKRTIEEKIFPPNPARQSARRN